MFGKVKRISLDGLDVTNNDLFVRKSPKKLSSSAVILVEDTHSAILIKNGEMINTMSSGRYPIFEKNENPKDTTVDVIFMSKTARLRTLWGTSQKMVMRDTATKEYFAIGASGEYEIQISNPRKFYLEVIGANKSYTIDDLKSRLLGRIVNEIERAISKLVSSNDTTFDHVAEYKRDIADIVLPVLQERFERDYGIKIYSFVISKMIVSTASSKDIELGQEKTSLPAKEQFLKELEALDYDKYKKVLAILEEDISSEDIVDTTTETKENKKQMLEE